MLAIAYYSGSSPSLQAISFVFGLMTQFGFSTPADLLTEYNSLTQLDNWLKSERLYLESESRQLDALKARLEEATRSYEYWKMMVQNQENLVAQTEAELNNWIQKRDELTRKRDEVQVNVNNLRSQLNVLTSQRTHLQSQLDTRQSQRKGLETSVAQKQGEIKSLQDSVDIAKSGKDAAESDLSLVKVSLARAKVEIGALRHELFLILAQPYLFWGGISLLAFSAVAFLGAVRHRIDISRLGILLFYFGRIGAKSGVYLHMVRRSLVSNISRVKKRIGAVRREVRRGKKRAARKKIPRKRPSPEKRRVSSV